MRREMPSETQDERPVPVLNRLQLMQFLQVYAGRGFVYWTSNHVRIDRVDDGWKLPAKHDANASHAVQQRRRRNGLPRVRLVVLDPHSSTHNTVDGTHAQWWLVATGPLEDEDLMDARRGDQRIVLGDMFELVRLSSTGNGPSWTWRGQPDGWAEFARRGHHYAQQTDLRKAEQLMIDLARWPSASGLNWQRRQLFSEMKWISKGRLQPPKIAYARFQRLV